MKRFKQDVGEWAPIGGYAGWNYPTSSFRFLEDYNSMDELISHIRQYEKNNNLPPLQDLRIVLENFFCSRKGMDKRCIDVYTPVDRTSKQVVTGIKAGLKMLYRQLTNSDMLASQEVAEKRAKICAGCPFNSKKEKPKLTDDIMKAIVSNKKTSKDSCLGVCTKCTCPLKAKVHCAEDIIAESLDDDPETRNKLSKHIVTDEVSFVCWQYRDWEKENGK